MYFILPTLEHKGQGQGLISTLHKVCIYFLLCNISIMSSLFAIVHLSQSRLDYEDSNPVWWVLRDSHLVYRCEPRYTRDTSRGCVTMSRHAWLASDSDNVEANWCNPLVIIVITQYCQHNPSPDGAPSPHTQVIKVIKWRWNYGKCFLVVRGIVHKSTKLSPNK